MKSEQEGTHKPAGVLPVGAEKAGSCDGGFIKLHRGIAALHRGVVSLQCGIEGLGCVAEHFIWIGKRNQ